MSRFLPIIILIAMIPLAGCVRDGYVPTYPTGGEYGGDDYYDGGDYGGGGGYYPPPPPPNYDDDIDWARVAEGEWEGFMWEEWRSDGRPLSKKIVAMRVNFRRVTYDYSGRHEIIKMDVLVDGRPVASKETEIKQSGNFSFASYKSDVDMLMQGRFTYSEAYGDIDLGWHEKVKNPWTGQMDEYFVDLGGYYEAGRLRHGHWAQAWELFDTHGDAVFDLDDSVWETATLEAMEHMAQVEETILRQPIQ